MAAGSYHDAQPEASCAEPKSGSTANNVVSKAQKHRFTIVEREVLRGISGDSQVLN